MKVQTRNLLLGGAVVLGGALCGWYLYKKSQPAKETESISRELLIQILKEQERESYPVLKCMSSIFMDILQRPEAKEMPPKELREKVFKQYSKIEPQYEAISKRTLEKYGVNIREYFHACEVTFKNDPEVQKLMQKSWIGFEMACQGIPPEFARTLPDFLTAEKTVEAYAKLLKKEAEKVKKVFEAVDKQGKSFWGDEEKVFSFVSSSRVEISTYDGMTKVLEAEGFDAFEEHPQRILYTAIEKYFVEDPIFKEKFLEVEDKRLTFLEELEKRKLQYAS